jgi:hypothetical protein
MDNFKKAKTDYITAWDLYSNCSGSYKNTNRKKMQQIGNRLARRRLKEELRKEL